MPEPTVWVALRDGAWKETSSNVTSVYFLNSQCDQNLQRGVVVRDRRAPVAEALVRQPAARQQPRLRRAGAAARCSLPRCVVVIHGGAKILAIHQDLSRSLPSFRDAG